MSHPQRKQNHKCRDCGRQFVENPQQKIISAETKHWIWLALDVDSREIVGVYVGNRYEAGAFGLWQSLPGVYR